MAKKRRNHDEEVGYWETMADGMIALLLLVLLIMMLLILYLVHIPDEDYIDLFRGDQYEEYQDAELGGGNHRQGEEYDEEGNQWEQEEESSSSRGSSGGGDDGEDGDEEGDEEDPDPGAGEGIGVDRAAVFVQVVDGETGRTIKLKGIEFELYGSNSALQVLSTYYPKKTDYQKYETDDKGVFYLPEKVVLGGYYLHQLTSLPGYDVSENIEFEVDKSYDWDDPFVVTVYLYPAKNVIEVQLLDKSNGQAVNGASFDVVAAENIITKDGTVRYKQGDVVDTIALVENGTGVSRELYLGKYVLREKEVPELYARVTQEYTVEIGERTSEESYQVTQVATEKTSLQVQLTDALLETTYISGAKFILMDDEGHVVERLTTDSKGRFSVTDLRKNTTYHIQQDATVGEYQLDMADHPFSISADGLIDGLAKGEMTLKNRMIRVKIGVRDKFFRGQVADITVSLRNDQDVVIKHWTTTGMEQTLTGLVPGKYTVEIAGDQNGAVTIEVEDATDIQSFQFDRVTTADIGAVIGLVVFLAGMVFVMRFAAKRRRQEKLEGGEN